MLHAAFAFVRWAAFERKAGSPFLSCFIVSLLKKILLFECEVNTQMACLEINHNEY